jgi:hypothetical protein
MNALDRVREQIRAAVERAGPIEDARRPLELIVEGSVRYREAGGELRLIVVDDHGQARTILKNGESHDFTLQDLVDELRAMHPSLFKPTESGSPETVSEGVSKGDVAPEPAAEARPVQEPSYFDVMQARRRTGAGEDPVPGQDPSAGPGARGAEPGPADRDWLKVASPPRAPSLGRVRLHAVSAPRTGPRRARQAATAPRGPNLEAPLPARFEIPDERQPYEFETPVSLGESARFAVNDIRSGSMFPWRAVAFAAFLLLAGATGYFAVSLSPDGEVSPAPSTAASTVPPSPAPAAPPAGAPPAATPAPVEDPDPNETNSVKPDAPAAAADPVPSDPGLLRGVPDILDAATLYVDGKVVHLFGVEWVRGGGDPEDLSRYLRGREVVCQPVPGSEAFRCDVEGQDLSKVVIFNGGGRARPEATPELKAAEEHARAARRGVWATATRTTH